MQQNESTSEYYDLFISHASENKEEVVKPLANELVDRGLKVWYDEFELTIGDSLRTSIDKGLSSSKYGVVVLSPDFFGKEWTQYELNGLVSRQTSGENVILPLWYNISKDEIIQHSPSLADIKALRITEQNIKTVANKLYSKINPELRRQRVRELQEKREEITSQLKNKRDIIANELPYHTIEYLNRFYNNNIREIRTYMAYFANELLNNEISIESILEIADKGLEKEYGKEHEVMISRYSDHGIKARRYVAVLGLLSNMYVNEGKIIPRGNSSN